MNRIDRLSLQVRQLTQRLAALEQSRRSTKRQPAPRPTDGVIDARERLWSKFVLLAAQYGRGRATRLNFAVKHALNPGEFSRWFSSRDRRGIPSGSVPDLNFHRALRTAIAELEARKPSTQVDSFDSHGNVTHAQLPAGRLQ